MISLHLSTPKPWISVKVWFNHLRKNEDLITLAKPWKSVQKIWFNWYCIMFEFVGLFYKFMILWFYMICYSSCIGLDFGFLGSSLYLSHLRHCLSLVSWSYFNFFCLINLIIRVNELIWLCRVSYFLIKMLASSLLHANYSIGKTWVYLLVFWVSRFYSFFLHFFFFVKVSRIYLDAPFINWPFLISWFYSKKSFWVF